MNCQLTGVPDARRTSNEELPCNPQTHCIDECEPMVVYIIRLYKISPPPPPLRRFFLNCGNVPIGKATSRTRAKSRGVGPDILWRCTVIGHGSVGPERFPRNRSAFYASVVSARSNASLLPKSDSAGTVKSLREEIQDRELPTPESRFWGNTSNAGPPDQKQRDQRMLVIIVAAIGRQQCQ